LGCWWLTDRTAWMHIVISIQRGFVYRRGNTFLISRSNNCLTFEPPFTTLPSVNVARQRSHRRHNVTASPRTCLGDPISSPDEVSSILNFRDDFKTQLFLSRLQAINDPRPNSALSLLPQLDVIINAAPKQTIDPASHIVCPSPTLRPRTPHLSSSLADAGPSVKLPHYEIWNSQP
jgi:hypothetical protein